MDVGGEWVAARKGDHDPAQDQGNDDRAQRDQQPDTSRRLVKTRLKLDAKGRAFLGAEWFQSCDATPSFWICSSGVPVIIRPIVSIRS